MSELLATILVIVFAMGFNYTNGFHDSANAIATIVGTRVLSPFAAVVWAATFNTGAPMVFQTAPPQPASNAR